MAWPSLLTSVFDMGNSSVTKGSRRLCNSTSANVGFLGGLSFILINSRLGSSYLSFFSRSSFKRASALYWSSTAWCAAESFSFYLCVLLSLWATSIKLFYGHSGSFMISSITLSDTPSFILRFFVIFLCSPGVFIRAMAIIKLWSDNCFLGMLEMSCVGQFEMK